MKLLLAGRPIQSAEFEGGLQIQRDLAIALSVNARVQCSVFGVGGGWVEGVEVVRTYNGTNWNLSRRIQFLTGLRKWQQEFDVVHCIHVPTGLNARALRTVSSRGRARGVRYVQTLSALPPDDRTLKERLWGDVIVAQSPRARNAIARVGGDVRLITPWPSPERVAFDPGRRAATRDVQFPEWERIILFPGEFKRLGVNAALIESLEVVFTDHPTTGVILACRFDSAGIGELIQQRFPGRVISLGTVSTGLVPLLEAADLVIYPAQRMSGKFQPPLVLLESLTVGTPVSVSVDVEMPAEASHRVFLSDFGDDWRAYGGAVSDLIARLPPRDPKPLFKDTVDSYLRVFESVVD